MERGKIYLKVRKTTLANLFGVSIHTINNWIWNKKIDPTSLEDIVEKFNNPNQLDRRRK